MHVRLLAGYAADALIRAAAIAELALKTIAGKPPEAKATLGELIDERRRSGRTELLIDASWLDQRYIVAKRFASQVRGELVAVALAVRFGGNALTHGSGSGTQQPQNADGSAHQQPENADGSGTQPPINMGGSGAEPGLHVSSSDIPPIPSSQTSPHAPDVAAKRAEPPFHPAIDVTLVALA